MSWVCSNCSSSNEEESTCCVVCGYDRPTKSRVREREPEVIEGKIVFSDFAVVIESVKGFFRTIIKIFIKIGKIIGNIIKSISSERAPRESREPKERVKLSQRKKTSREKKGFAKPWPEHNIKFDVDVIKSKGFVRSERTEMNAIKGYTFYKADGMSQFIKADMLVVLRMAIRL
ncbi:MAG: hypothetical protein J6S23_00605 [Clostridia bacterium]|nr:hypothetical protein [Clostridia bacterium]